MIKKWIIAIINFLKVIIGKNPNKEPPKFLLEEIEGNDLMCVRIKGGAFNNTVFCFRKVMFQEPENKNMPLTLKFEYDIMECVDEQMLEDNLQTFEQMLGDYLMTILEEGNDVIESKRTHNPLFAANERDVFEEDSSVSSD